MKYLHENGYECLTKENFWDDIKEKYPEEFEHFSKWVDKYKTRVGWNYLFKNHHDLPSRSIKYHDLPVAMQGGILAYYLSEQKWLILFEISNFIYDAGTAVERIFRVIHYENNRKKEGRLI